MRGIFLRELLLPFFAEQHCPATGRVSCYCEAELAGSFSMPKRRGSGSNEAIRREQIASVAGRGSVMVLVDPLHRNDRPGQQSSGQKAIRL
jgi:hypothetical protein